MKFVVKTLDGKNKSYDLDESTTVAILKEMVYKDLGIASENQRMILQGKVLKDEMPLSNYAPEGKTIHLVKNAPPTSQIATNVPPLPADMQPTRNSIDFMYVGADLPKLPPPEGTPFIQDIAKENANSVLTDLKTKLPEAGNYLVTVTMHTLNSDGRPIMSATHTSTTHTALIDNAILARDPPPPPPQTEETEAEAEIRRKKKEEEETTLRRIRLERYKERVEEQQKRGREQTNILEIYQHMTSARRAIAGAENIIEEYFASEEYKEANELLEHTLRLRAEAKEREKQKGESDKTDKPLEEVPMEQGGATGDATADDGEKKVEPANKDGIDYSIGEDGRPRQHILTDSGMLIPAGSALFSSLLKDLITLENRGIELQNFYITKIETEEHYEFVDYKINNKLLTTVQRFHNAIGQACDALKKVQVQLDAEPPRIVSLTSRPRPATNPLLSLLSQPLSNLRDSDSEEESSGAAGRSGGSGDGHSVAGLFGSLLAARALGSLMQDDNDTNTTSSNDAGTKSDGNKEPTVTEANGDGTSGTGSGTTAGGATGGTDSSSNVFLPDPVRMMAEIAKENARKRQQEQEERTVVIQPNESFFDVISRIRQAVGGPEAEILPPTIVGDLIEMCFKKMTIVEVVTVFGGDPAPINSVHGTFREFISTKLLNGETPTDENTPQAIEAFIAGVPAMLSELTPPLPLNPDIDFAASVQKCSRIVLKEAFDMIINTPDDDADFGKKIYEWAETSGALMTCIVRESLLSSNDLTPSMKRLARLMFPDNDTPGVVSMLNSHSLVEKFIEDAEKSTLTEEEIESYLVYVPEEDGEEEKMETDPPKKEEEITGVNGEKFPASMPKEWAGTIKNDVEEMKKTNPQPPLSSAYLSAGPSKKRKQLESGEAEPVHVTEILGDMLENSIISSGSKPKADGNVDAIIAEAKTDSDLVSGLGEEMYAATQKRLEEDPDYKPDKYPSTQEHFQPNVGNK